METISLELRGVSKRLTPTLASKGFTAVPQLFLECYHELKVNSSEAMVIIHLLSYKWNEKKPFPRLNTLANRMGLGESTVRGHLASLEKKGLVKRILRPGTSNQFDLTPLFQVLEGRLNNPTSPKRRRKEVKADGEED